MVSTGAAVSVSFPSPLPPKNTVPSHPNRNIHHKTRMTTSVNVRIRVARSFPLPIPVSVRLFATRIRDTAGGRMLWLWAMALGWATVPDRVDVDNIEHWEAGMNRLLDGPEGCWELVGKASWEWDFGRFGSSRGDAAFIGRMRGGVWEGFHVESFNGLAGCASSGWMVGIVGSRLLIG